MHHVCISEFQQSVGLECGSFECGTADLESAPMYTHPTVPFPADCCLLKSAVAIIWGICMSAKYKSFQHAIVGAPCRIRRYRHHITAEAISYVVCDVHVSWHSGLYQGCRESSGQARFNTTSDNSVRTKCPKPSKKLPYLQICVFEAFTAFVNLSSGSGAPAVTATSNL